MPQHMSTTEQPKQATSSPTIGVKYAVNNAPPAIAILPNHVLPLKLWNICPMDYNRHVI